MFGVEEVSRVEDVETIQSVADLYGSECFETPLWAYIHIGAVHHVFHFYTELYVFAVLRIRDIVTQGTVFGIDDEISDAVF